MSTSTCLSCLCFSIHPGSCCPTIRQDLINQTPLLERSLIYIFCLVGHLPLRTTSSTVVHFKNFLPTLSPWQSSAHYYDCSVPFTPARDLSVWDRSFRQLTTLLCCWSHGIYGGLPHGGPTSTSISWGSVLILSSLWGKERWGEKMIYFGLRDILAFLLVWSSRGEYGGCFHAEEILARSFGFVVNTQICCIDFHHVFYP